MVIMTEPLFICQNSSYTACRNMRNPEIQFEPKMAPDQAVGGGIVATGTRRERIGETHEEERIDAGKVLEDLVGLNLMGYPGVESVRHGTVDEDRRLKKDLIVKIKSPYFTGEIPIDCSMTTDQEKIRQKRAYERAGGPLFLHLSKARVMKLLEERGTAQIIDDIAKRCAPKFSEELKKEIEEQLYQYILNRIRK